MSYSIFNKKYFFTVALLLLNVFVFTLFSKSVYSTTLRITWKKFFPEIVGKLEDNQVALPDAYISCSLADFGAEGILWGEPADIRFISLSNGDPKIDLAQHPVLKVRFSPKAGVVDGRLSDENGPLTEASLTNQGFKNLKYVSGLFNRMKNVPIVAVSGELKGVLVYQIYLYSPDNDQVVFVSMHGGKDKSERDLVWKVFIESLNIK